MTKLNLNENELAERWGVSSKTLQRWRTERRGPPYLKLSKRVTYPLEDILAFETSQKMATEGSLRPAIKIGAAKPFPDGHDPAAPGAPEVVMVAQNDRSLVTATQIIYVTGLPRHYFENAEMRARLEIPHYLLGRQVRFKLDEIHQWERAKGSLATTGPIVPISTIFQPGPSTTNGASDGVDQVQRPDHISTTDQQRSAPAATDDELISAKEAIRLTQLPAYYFKNRVVREELGVPHYMVGRLVRFKSVELNRWQMQHVCNQEAAQPARPPATPEVPKMALHEALRRLNDGTLSR